MADQKVHSLTDIFTPTNPPDNAYNCYIYIDNEGYGDGRISLTNVVKNYTIVISSANQQPDYSIIITHNLYAYNIWPPIIRGLTSKKLYAFKETQVTSPNVCTIYFGEALEERVEITITAIWV